MSARLMSLAFVMRRPDPGLALDRAPRPRRRNLLGLYLFHLAEAHHRHQIPEEAGISDQGSSEMRSTHRQAETLGPRTAQGVAARTLSPQLCRLSFYPYSFYALFSSYFQSPRPLPLPRLLVRPRPQQHCSALQEAPVPWSSPAAASRPRSP